MPLRVDRKTEFCELVERGRVVRGFDSGHASIHENSKSSATHLARVQRAERSSGGVAGIPEEWFVLCGTTLVEFFKGVGLKLCYKESYCCT